MCLLLFFFKSHDYKAAGSMGQSGEPLSTTLLIICITWFYFKLYPKLCIGLPQVLANVNAQKQYIHWGKNNKSTNFICFGNTLEGQSISGGIMRKHSKYPPGKIRNIDMRRPGHW